MPTFLEFFAGGGMARAGLGKRWDCLFANDLDPKKASAYEANWGKGELILQDVAKLSTDQIPQAADLAWASFPCQDLSLAGSRAGLQGERSGSFWGFWQLLMRLDAQKRAPNIVAIENVAGLLRSRNGEDFAAIGEALVAGGYRFGAVVIDAVHFVPQSRPRLFLVGVKDDIDFDPGLVLDRPDPRWHPKHLMDTYELMPERLRNSWIWWNLPSPPKRRANFSDIIESEPKGVVWHTQAETRRLLTLMSPVNLRKVEQAKQLGSKVVGGIYKRTRVQSDGKREQRAEVRFDEIAGCLRTPTGGSSRQTILVVDGNVVRSRLLSPREAARLMGLKDSYRLPPKYNDAYHLAGDGVVVDVVRFLAENLFEPLIESRLKKKRQAA